MRRLSLLALTLIALPATASTQEAALPDWMAGCWEMRDGDRWAEECWTVPRGGMMMGSGRAGVVEDVRSWEFMRIVLDEPNANGPTIRMAFAASPGGQGWTVFASTPDPDGGVTFVNAANDYPQRIRYWREGERLRARISAMDGSRPVEWTFEPMGR